MGEKVRYYTATREARGKDFCQARALSTSTDQQGSPLRGTPPRYPQPIASALGVHGFAVHDYVMCWLTVQVSSCSRMLGSTTRCQLSISRESQAEMETIPRQSDTFLAQESQKSSPESRRFTPRQGTSVKGQRADWETTASVIRDVFAHRTLAATEWVHCWTNTTKRYALLTWEWHLCNTANLYTPRSSLLGLVGHHTSLLMHVGSDKSGSWSIAKKEQGVMTTHRPRTL